MSIALPVRAATERKAARPCTPTAATRRARPKRQAIPSPCAEALAFVALLIYPGVVLEVVHHMAWDGALDAPGLLARVDAYMAAPGPGWWSDDLKIADAWRLALLQEPAGCLALAGQMLAARHGGTA